jgi:hypothetical protein
MLAQALQSHRCSSLLAVAFSAGAAAGRKPPPELPAQFCRRFLVLIEPVSSWCLNPRALNTNWEEKLSIQFGRQGGVTHQLSGEPKMRFVSTALVMMAIALMLLALMLLTPGA